MGVGARITRVILGPHGRITAAVRDASGFMVTVLAVSTIGWLLTLAIWIAIAFWPVAYTVDDHFATA